MRSWQALTLDIVRAEQRHHVLPRGEGLSEVDDTLASAPIPVSSEASALVPPSSAPAGVADTAGLLARKRPAGGLDGPVIPDADKQRLAVLAKVQGVRSAARHIAAQASVPASPAGSNGHVAAAPMPARKRRVDIDQIGSHSPQASLAFVEQLTPSLQQQRRAMAVETGTQSSYQQMAVRMDGQMLGSVAFQVSEQREMLVHLGQILDLFEDRFDKAQFARLRSADNSERFLSVDQLASAGVQIRYNAAYDELIIVS